MAKTPEQRSGAESEKNNQLEGSWGSEREKGQGRGFGGGWGVGRLGAGGLTRRPVLLTRALRHRHSTSAKFSPTSSILIETSVKSDLVSHRFPLTRELVPTVNTLHSPAFLLPALFLHHGACRHQFAGMPGRRVRVAGTITGVVSARAVDVVSALVARRPCAFAALLWASGSSGLTLQRHRENVSIFSLTELIPTRLQLSCYIEGISFHCIEIRFGYLMVIL